MKKKILILAGGISKERLISLGTGLQVAKELKKNGYKVKICEPDGSLSKNINRFKPNVIFNALHGQFGEDGYIQTILEGFKIPYTHSGVIASSLAMDKAISKKIFIQNKINTPKYIQYYYKEIMIEEFIGGREIQVAIMGNKKLGAIELKPKRKFYDYKAKYSANAKTEHIIPVEITKNKLNEVMDLSLKAHKIIGCKGVTRSDFKFYKNKFYLLEINTQPGMTRLSLVPEIAKYKGISFIKLIEWILKDATTKK